MTDEVWNTERLHDHFAQSLRVSEMYYDSKTEHQRLKVFQNGTFGRVLT
ncbi:polyamine aminopropyltransferase, partial [Rhodobacteraceae bacterium R_SAG5]|nr:polyamine aminopropyltransferase [Rhodobacteraceae bacterium R_SAG5]